MFTELTRGNDRALGKLVPLEDRGKPKRKSRPWYNSQLLEQRKVTGNRERKGHSTNIERIITGGYLLGNGLDTME